MEKIISIEEYSDRYWDGYEIKTTEQSIKLLIENGQSCCESWGYFMSQDDFSMFINAEIINIYLTDTALANKDVLPDDVTEGYVMFVNINTSVGLLQFVAYNDHNGYYGHVAKVCSTQLSHAECL